MKKLYRFNLYAILSLLALVVFLPSCDDDDMTSSEVQLLSFGPSGVKHGEKIKFIGLNLDKVTAIVLPPDIEVTNFETQSSSLIEIVVPKAAEAGKVMLKTPQGDIESLSVLSFEVPVTITSITEEARPGSNITITGDLLNWVDSIAFNDGVMVGDFESQSMTELVVQVPMEAQTGFLIFSTGGTEPLTFASEEELVVTLPEVTSLTPSSARHTENLTITGTDLDLVTAVVFAGDQSVAAANFISHSATEITLSVPAMSIKGPLTLKQASPVDVVTADELTIILPVGTDVSPSPATPGEDNVTITGTDLDLVADLTFSGTEPIASADFVSHSATEIVVAVPEGAKNGAISYTTINGYSNSLGINLVIPGEGPPPLAVTMFDDAIVNGGGDYSWNIDVSDPANTEQVYSGDVSWKFTTTSDGGVSAGGMSPGVDGSGQNVFAFSLYGGPGTDGAQVAAILNDDWSNYNAVTLVEGAWTEYEIDLANYPAIDLTNVTRWTFKVEKSGTTIYVDRVGFGAGGPPPLDYYIYDDAVQNGWAEWGGWDHDVQDFANTEEVFSGDMAIKMVFSGQYGALQLGSPGTDVFSGYSTLSFQVYAVEAQDLIVQIGDNSDTYLSVPQGWSVVELPIADLEGNDNVGELRIKNNNANLPTTLYIDEVGLRN